MNQKRKYITTEPNPVYLYEATVKGRRLQVHMEATLERGIGYPSGRYRFCYSETLRDGSVMLIFFGPTRRKKQRYRTARPESVVTVHTKTKP